MTLPIVAFGSPVLRKKCIEITSEYSQLNNLIENMWETMYHANGVGLAAPQINKSIRLFLIDTTPFIENEEKDDVIAIKKTFINPRIIEETGDEWDYNEGCLSIPGIRAEVTRPETILLKYQDIEQNIHETYFTGLVSRVIQHEMDHLDGKLFIDYLSQTKRILIKKRLLEISKKGRPSSSIIL